MSRLPQGYDTVISDDGGGLLTRAKTIALHRACVMMGQPNMLILDEATSSIDTRIEFNI